MGKISLSVLLCNVLVYSGCQSNHTVKRQTLAHPPGVDRASTAAMTQQFGYQYFIYTLEGLSTGTAGASDEMTSSTERLRNDAVSTLLNAQLTPVYVAIENISSIPIEVHPCQFELVSANRVTSAIEPKNLPQFIGKSDGEKAAEAVSKIIAVIVLILLLIVLVAVIGRHNGSSGSGGNYFGGFSNCNSCEQGQTPTVIDYNHSLLSAKRLLPGEKTSGFIFFNTPLGDQSRSMELRVGQQAFPVCSSRDPLNAK